MRGNRKDQSEEKRQVKPAWEMGHIGTAQTIYDGEPERATDDPSIDFKRRRRVKCASSRFNIYDAHFTVLFHHPMPSSTPECASSNLLDAHSGVKYGLRMGQVAPVRCGQ